jgi:hypothetical protein
MPPSRVTSLLLEGFGQPVRGRRLLSPAEDRGIALRPVVLVGAEVIPPQRRYGCTEGDEQAERAEQFRWKHSPDA